ncbi:Pnap_2097 family protein [Burkholderia perseverans]|uniref:Pnap_2097 family protein n=1 Tax=Burkholderia perseverans TaxID=2615214 RepID=UPI001FED5899|nr:Pnap_2097 family protein [Burkholderia perseverans]
MQTRLHRYRAGMPQLGYTGLAENWLLKECGHRHWEALAAHAGRDAPDFVDDRGRRAYAAFVAIRVVLPAPSAIDENDAFEIALTLRRVGAVRHASEQRIVRGGVEVGSVTMLSTFVTRERAGSNRSVARARFAALGGALDEAGTLPEAVAALASRGRALRERDPAAVPAWAQPLAATDAGPIEAAEFLPCPNNDFNGADLLYFASFQAFVDRAEWQRHRFARPPALVSRVLHFHGNLDLGDTLRVQPLAEQRDGARLRHWCELVRGADGMKIADVITEKTWEAA